VCNVTLIAAYKPMRTRERSKRWSWLVSLTQVPVPTSASALGSGIFAQIEWERTQIQA
jgi:hypothetical protein